MTYPIWFLLGIAVMVSGCGGAPVVLEKAGSQPGEFEDAKYDCSVQMDHSSGAIAYRQDPLAHMYYPVQARRDMLNCLKRKGWTEQAPAK